ncbi:LacI family DNA-binding transcriptional regulator [Musicola keenii]|uniref:LacI family DNA-binding transcriptional regulator n=1 Tax=Musicola keenii TaxID=2884250 RepID=UPI00177C511B|nr:LacI family DNA-binding transcriptional regulator [Musicola keenii]
MKTKPVTLNEVAAYAGVSYQTVSRVLNRSPQVSPATKEKVEQAMAALNYIPNRVAQQLARRRPTTIGLATIDLSLHAPSQIAAAIKTTASEQSFNVVVAMLSAADGYDARRAVSELLAQRVDGIIVNVPQEPAMAEPLNSLCATTPVLFLDTQPDTPWPRVMFDPIQGARLAIEHLVTREHRRIALLTGPLSAVSARLRYEGWLQGLREHQLTPCAVAEGDWSAQSGYRCTPQLLTASPQPSAIVVANDQMALGVLRALHEYGLSVPDQISVIGFDDTQDSAYYQPPLTTIRQDFRQLGHEAVLHLVARLLAQEPAASLLLETVLVERQTTAHYASKTPDTQAIAHQLIALARRLQG